MASKLTTLNSCLPHHSCYFFISLRVLCPFPDFSHNFLCIVSFLHSDSDVPCIWAFLDADLPSGFLLTLCIALWFVLFTLENSQLLSLPMFCFPNLLSCLLGRCHGRQSILVDDGSELVLDIVILFPLRVSVCVVALGLSLKPLILCPV